MLNSPTNPNARSQLFMQNEVPCVAITNERATAVIALQGGQVLNYCPQKASQEILYLSNTANFKKNKAIRGGIPVCWPWFGPDPEARGRPQHGFARTEMWEVRNLIHADDGTSSTLTLGLVVNHRTRELWRHAFGLTLEITVGDSLTLALTTENCDSEAFEVTQALHSYFAVPSIHDCTVNGLEGCNYIDKLDDGRTKTQAHALNFDGPVDRIYSSNSNRCELLAGNEQKRTLVSEGSGTTVIWTPWEVGAKAMADMPDDDYQHFVCIETANAGSDRVVIKPGEQHRLSVTVMAK